MSSINKAEPRNGGPELTCRLGSPSSHHGHHEEVASGTTPSDVYVWTPWPHLCHQATLSTIGTHEHQAESPSASRSSHQQSTLTCWVQAAHMDEDIRLPCCSQRTNYNAPIQYFRLCPSIVRSRTHSAACASSHHAMSHVHVYTLLTTARQAAIVYLADGSRTCSRTPRTWTSHVSPLKELRCRVCRCDVDGHGVTRSRVVHPCTVSVTGVVLRASWIVVRQRRLRPS